MCSDAMTRGMDVAGVANVVNYDAPVYVKTYVHRAGRTARAGEPGARAPGCGGRCALGCVCVWVGGWGWWVGTCARARACVCVCALQGECGALGWGRLFPRGRRQRQVALARPAALPAGPQTLNPPTLRAGRAGRVFTLLRHEDVRHFKGMLRKADNTFVRAHRLAKGALEAVRDDVDAALEAMGAALAAEAEAERARGGAAGPAAAVAPAVAKEAATAATGVVAEGQAARAAGGQQRAWGGGRGAPKRRKVSEAPEFSLLPPAP